MLKIVLLLLVLVSLGLAGPTRERRIVGGHEAVDGQFPFMVSIRDFWNMAHLCGGAIVRERWIVTTATCMIHGTPQNTRIVAGSIYFQGGLNAFTHAVSNITRHPDFSLPNLENDIALVRVSVPFLLSRFIHPIRIGSEFHAGGQRGTLMGWGSTRQDGGGTVSPILQWINTNVMSNAECNSAFMGQRNICTCQICSFASIARGGCVGDIGGPLVVGDSLVGLLTYVRRCAVGFPDVFTRISLFHSWILNNSLN